MIEVEEIVEYTSEEEEEEDDFDELPASKSVFGAEGKSPTSSKRSGIRRKGTMNSSVKKKASSDMKSSQRKNKTPRTEEKLQWKLINREAIIARLGIITDYFTNKI